MTYTLNTKKERKAALRAAHKVARKYAKHESRKRTKHKDSFFEFIMRRDSSRAA